MTWRIELGDCRERMAALPAETFDAIVTDPPYGLGFMGKEWDHGVPGVQFWTEALRVAKPGAHLVAFGGTRTFHRLAVSIEDAGWEMRDCLSWLYGSGFPKSLNIQQAMNKAARGTPQGGADPSSPNHGKFKGGCTDESPTGRGFGAGAGAFMREPGERRGDDDGMWHGWGTALKPAWEPIILARKPLVGTVAANVAAHGTGGLNIDGCRIGTEGGMTRHTKSDGEHRDRWDGNTATGEVSLHGGRWPANVCLDEDAARLLDAQSGELKSGFMAAGTIRNARTSVAMGRMTDNAASRDTFADTGGASRFFYCAKASRSERNAGLEGMPERKPHADEPNGRAWDIPGSHSTERANFHPTVKPIDLMRWLCRLVTPAGGLILDPFTGSGTTGCAAVAEGFRFHGMELAAEYVPIAERRIAHWAKVAAEESAQGSLLPGLLG